jgi:hypothetical protein
MLVSLPTPTLAEEDVEISKILLDPNNPRLVGLTRTEATEEGRIGDTSVQESVFNELKTHLYEEVKATRDSILRLGFLPLDKIVLRKYQDTPVRKFVVVEGNERVAAIKWILQDQGRGELTVPDERLRALQRINVLILQGTDDEVKRGQWIIQGIRHILGVHAWGPYQQAKTIIVFLQGGMDTHAVADALTITVTQVNRLRRSYLAFEKFREDEEFGQFWHPNLFSYFEEVMNRPKLRDEWLGWEEASDLAGEFTNEANIRLFYSWITSPDPATPKKIGGALQMRYLPEILDDQEVLTEFTNNDQMDIELAHSRIQTRRATSQSIDWRGELHRLIDVMNNRIPLGAFTEEDAQLFADVIATAQQKLEQIRRLRNR